ncbi:CZB domain-containing protein [Chromobacterium alticapitis]|uniref:Chemotaxis protein n=1 Tax=Chromobacterium alticapitis TaxID=2073169 RepID=A0A2S5DBK4_9NEIS|nr:CZB domain-containing protein [Chromobacterium alticapitis]POZ60414.1 chemotaxis protein [Chromobacterium alticapitis]
MDLEQEIVRHNAWKDSLREAIFRQEALDAALFARDDCCELGQWLHGHGASLYGGLGIFHACLSRHTMLHREIGRIARLINQRCFQEAESALNDAAFDVAVSAAVSSMRQLSQAISRGA